MNEQYKPAPVEHKEVGETPIDEEMKSIREIQKMRVRVEELEKNDSRSESEDDEYVLLKRRIERAEEEDGSVTTWEDLVNKYDDLPKSSCKRAGLESDELTFLPNGEVVLLKRVANYDYDQESWEIINKEEAKKMLASEHARLEKEINNMNNSLSGIDKILKSI